jgi:imidazolonepropionase-like amidohydrolase
MKALTFAVALCLSAAAALSETLAITNARIVPVGAPVIEKGTLLVENGRILALGLDVSIPPGATVRDASGLTVYPGLVEADTTLGLSEIGAVGATVDLDELGDFNPEARAQIALHSDSEILPTIRANGITTSMVSPRGGVVSGRSSFIQHEGWTWEEMTLVSDAALSIDWPSRPDPDASSSERERAAARVKKLEELLTAAGDYAESSSRAPHQANASRRRDLRLEALAPFVRGERPVLIRANGKSEIEAAVEIIGKYRLKGALVGAGEAWKVAALLKEKNVPVILPVLRLPAEREDPYDSAYAAPALLKEAGVRFAISTLSGTDARNLPYHAAVAAAHGLGSEEALKAVTLYPAEILGVADRVGSLTPGKRADLILARGDILDVRTEIVSVYVAGRAVDLETRHTRLYEKWKKR